MTKRTRKVRIGPLETVGHVVTELGRVYRLARRGELEMDEAKSLTYMLREIRCALEAGDVERRLEELETTFSPESAEPWKRSVGMPSYERH